jgi:hypothetical protein
VQYILDSNVMLVIYLTIMEYPLSQKAYSQFFHFDKRSHSRNPSYLILNAPKMKDRLLKYLRSDRHLWWTVTVIPESTILYLYTNNFTLVNSWVSVDGFYTYVHCITCIEILILDFSFQKMAA